MQNVNIFVYGSLKKNYRNHYLIKDSIINSFEATIKGTLYDINLGFPALQLKGNYTIHGQVITIPLNMLSFLDRFQGVPFAYQREKITINKDNKNIDAFVYTMRALPQNASIIKSGSW